MSDERGRVAASEITGNREAPSAGYRRPTERAAEPQETRREPDYRREQEPRGDSRHDETEGDRNPLADFDPKAVEEKVRENRKVDPNYLKGSVTSGGGGTEKLPEDIYDAELVNIQIIKLPSIYANGELKDSYEWFFQIINDRDYTGKVLRGVSSLSLHENSKANAWASAIMGVSLRVGEQVDLAALFGKPCRIKVESNKNGYSTVTDVLKVSSRPR
jgi:hypothetical protein